MRERKSGVSSKLHSENPKVPVPAFVQDQPKLEKRAAVVTLSKTEVFALQQQDFLRQIKQRRSQGLIELYIRFNQGKIPPEDLKLLLLLLAQQIEEVCDALGINHRTLVNLSLSVDSLFLRLDELEEQLADHYTARVVGYDGRAA